jgi:NADPH:quinone reductase-like Zn-dependent oxidoreductase
MKAIQMTAYGDSSVLRLQEVEKPAAGAGEVLIKVAATTVNPLDMKIRSGMMQKMMPVPFPFTPGLDVAGTVEAVGGNVSRIKPGDKVFATTFGGTYAEYFVLNEAVVCPMPGNTDFYEAASLAVPLTTAYSLLVEAGDVQPGQMVLIHGASGGVGSVMVQVAKAMGAYVIGTASGPGVDLVRSLCADEVIDYKSQDFSQLVSGVDVVIDTVGGQTQIKSFAVVQKGGKLLSIFMPPSADLAAQYGITAEFVSSAPGLKKLLYGKQLVEANEVRANIAKVMKLEEAAAAQDLVSAGGVNGKVILVC